MDYFIPPSALGKRAGLGRWPSVVNSLSVKRRVTDGRT
jgi:hypothetical protein